MRCVTLSHPIVTVPHPIVTVRVVCVLSTQYTLYSNTHSNRKKEQRGRRKARGPFLGGTFYKTKKISPTKVWTRITGSKHSHNHYHIREHWKPGIASPGCPTQVLFRGYSKHCFLPFHSCLLVILRLSVQFGVHVSCCSVCCVSQQKRNPGWLSRFRRKRKWLHEYQTAQKASKWPIDMNKMTENNVSNTHEITLVLDNLTK